MKSIRGQMTDRLVVGLLLLLAMADSALYLYIRATLTNQFDDAMLGKARVLSALVKQEYENGRPKPLEFDFSADAMPEFQWDTRAEFFQIRSLDGKTLARSRSLGDIHLSHRPEGRSPAFRDLLLPDGTAGRSVEFMFPVQIEGAAPADAPTILCDIVLARDRHSIDQPLEILLTALVVTAGCVFVGILVLVRGTIRAGLRPLDRVAEAASGIDVRSLDYRFPTDGLPAEMQPICRRLNDLLSRLDEAFQRERRFNADVAHELRTPIAELRSLAEVAIKFPGDAQSASQNARDTLDIARQMESLVTTLLSLSRCQSGRQTVALQPVDLPQLVREAWHPFESPAGWRNLVVEFDLSPLPPVPSDPAILGSILTNLFSNAVAYTPSAGRISCRLSASDGGFLFEMTNANATLTSDDLPHLGEAFWRKDSARTSSPHAGLGLALTRAYAQLLDLELSLELPTPESFRASLRGKQ